MKTVERECPPTSPFLEHRVGSHWLAPIGWSDSYRSACYGVRAAPGTAGLDLIIVSGTQMV